MALNWLLHSAYTIFVGYPKDCKVQGNDHNGTIVGYPKEEAVMGSDSLQACPSSGFQMPLHYPRYRKADYETMEEWKVDMLLREYGLSFKGTLDEKRAYAMGAFLWSV